MLKLVRSIVAVLASRFRSRAVLELENLALRHQLHVLRRQRPGRPRLFTLDRVLWVWLYRLWPLCSAKMKSPSRSVRYWTVLVVKSVQDRARDHRGWSVKSMPLALQSYRQV
jgi:acetolactate synthase regulatory subunit